MNLNTFLFGLKLNATQISGVPTGAGILFGGQIKNGFKYVNGNKTEEIVTQNYTMCFPITGATDITVKVPGNKPVLTAEQIEQKGEVRLAFKNLVGKFYKDSNGNLCLTCNADAVEVI